MAFLAIVFVILTVIELIKSIGLIKHNIEVIPSSYAFNDIEIAAKSIGYWENRSLTGPPEEALLCVKGLLAAQRRLIALTGDYVPDEAKTILNAEAPSPLEVLPEGVVSLDLARKTDQTQW